MDIRDRIRIGFKRIVNPVLDRHNFSITTYLLLLAQSRSVIMDVNSAPFWFYYPESLDSISVEQPSGKWMLYYRNEDIDDAWEMAMNKYKKLKKVGIPAMKCSNRDRQNPRASSNETQVIIFYCGPSTEKKKMKRIGKKLIKIMDYRSPSTDKIFYKSDRQTDSGTRATGTKINHLYKLPVELLYSQSDDDEDEEKPATELGQYSFTKAKPEWDYKISGLPSVRLHFRPEHINTEWRRAKQLLIGNSFGEEVVAVDTATMKAQTSGNSQLLRMKFYLNIDVSQCSHTQMVDFIRMIYKKMKSVTDPSVGLYKFQGRKPIATFTP